MKTHRNIGGNVAQIPTRPSSVSLRECFGSLLYLFSLKELLCVRKRLVNTTAYKVSEYAQIYRN